MLMTVAGTIVYSVFFRRRSTKEKEFAPFESECQGDLRQSELRRAEAMDTQLQQLDRKPSTTKAVQLGDLLGGGSRNFIKHHSDFNRSPAATQITPMADFRVETHKT